MFYQQRHSVPRGGRTPIRRYAQCRSVLASEYETAYLFQYALSEEIDHLPVLNIYARSHPQLTLRPAATRCGREFDQEPVVGTAGERIVGS